MVAKACSRLDDPTVRQAQPLNRISSFFNHLAHQLQRPVENGFRLRIRWQAVHCHMHLHGNAQESLQQRIVQLLCDSRPFRQAFIESLVDAGRHLSHPQMVKRPDQKHGACAAECDEPACLKPRRRDA